MAPQSETASSGLWSYLSKVMIVIVAACIIFVLVGPDTQAIPLAYLGIALGGVVWMIPLIRHVAALFRTPSPPQRPKVPPEQVYLVHSKAGTMLLTAGQELPPESQDTVVQELWAGKPIRVDIDHDTLYPTRDEQVISCTLAITYTFRPDLVDQDILPILNKTLLEESPLELIDEIKNELMVFFADRDQKQAITRSYQDLRGMVQSLFDRCCRDYGLVLLPDFKGVNLHIAHPPDYIDALKKYMISRFNTPYGNSYGWGGSGGSWTGSRGRSGGMGGGAGWETRDGGSAGIGKLPKTHWNEFKRSITQSITDFASMGMHFGELVEYCLVEGARLDDLLQHGIRFDGVMLSELKLYGVDCQSVSKDRMVQMGIRLDQ